MMTLEGIQPPHEFPPSPQEAGPSPQALTRKQTQEGSHFPRDTQEQGLDPEPLLPLRLFLQQGHEV